MAHGWWHTWCWRRREKGDSNGGEDGGVMWVGGGGSQQEMSGGGGSQQEMSGGGDLRIEKKKVINVILNFFWAILRNSRAMYRSSVFFLVQCHLVVALLLLAS